MGRVEEGCAAMQRAVDLRDRVAAARQGDGLNMTFVSSSAATGPMGVMGHLDTYLKAGLLGLRPAARPTLLLPPGEPVSNGHFLEYWRQYVDVIDDPLRVRQLMPVARLLEDPVHFGVSCNGTMLLHPSASALVAKQWKQEQRAPLLSLNDADREWGWSCLARLGVPKGAWFVAIHVRDGGYKDTDGIQDSFRNADIDTYAPAIAAIVRRGGWVIRLGNPKMKPLRPMPQVTDYAHSDARSDRLDVFLCAASRLTINTSSGPQLIGSAFGVPDVMTNLMPTWSVGMGYFRFVPKMCWSESERRLLTFAELFSPPVSTSLLQHHFDDAGVTPIDNTADEIEAVVVEALDALDGTARYTPEDERRQGALRQLTADCGTLIGLDHFAADCRMGRDFLSKYSGLLQPRDESAARRESPQSIHAFISR